MPDLNASSRADADIDPHLSADRRALGKPTWPTLAVISAGGAIGALARYGLSAAFPHRVGAFPWATFATNVVGCLLIGVLMVLVAEVWTGHRWVRPFLGVGVLGGFTTFSTYTLEIVQALDAGAAPVALTYLGATLLAALTAVWTGTTITSWAIGLRPVAQAVLATAEEET